MSDKLESARQAVIDAAKRLESNGILSARCTDPLVDAVRCLNALEAESSKPPIRAWRARGILELVRKETGGQRARLN